MLIFISNTVKQFAESWFTDDHEPDLPASANFPFHENFGTNNNPYLSGNNVG
jgi:hypothetical protein